MKTPVSQKNKAVTDDQNFLEGINLVTGDKIDYTKHILSDLQVNLLCTDHQLTKLQKFILIINQGEKIQKWSIFENITLYIDNINSAQTILALIEKNYEEYDQYVTILGEGLLNYLKKAQNNPQILNKKCYDILFRLLKRTLTSVKHQGSDALTDWMLLLTTLFHLPTDTPLIRLSKLSEMKQYINGSFSMNTLPQRRKTALQMINALVGVIISITKLAHSKIVFFNGDLNPQTRLVICNIVQKIIEAKQGSIELWKCIIDYYRKDNNAMVREKSLQILTQYYQKTNANMLFDELTDEEPTSVALLSKHLPYLLKSFEIQLKQQSSYQLKVISFLNRLLRQNMDQNLGRVIECYRVLADSIGENMLTQSLQLKRFNLQNSSVVTQLIHFHTLIHHIQFGSQIKKQVMKGLRFHDFEIKGDIALCSDLLQLLDLTNDEQISIFILLLSRQIDNSKWPTLPLFLSTIPKIKLYQNHYEKIEHCIIKLYANCAYFLLPQIHTVMLYLLLNDRKNMDLLHRLKEKFLTSRCWTHRRNYIKLYFFLKTHASYEFNKYIPTLAYKNLLNQKNCLIQQEFIKQAEIAFSYIDSDNQQQKNIIKETLNCLKDVKDREVAQAALSALQKIKETEKDFQLTHTRMQQNKQLQSQEQLFEQVQSESKKHIKTQKLIERDYRQPKQAKDKLKKSTMQQTKTTSNLLRFSSNGQKSKPLITESKSILRSSSSQHKHLLTKPAANKKSKF